jgi:RNA polymerase sigma-B factor
MTTASRPTASTAIPTPPTGKRKLTAAEEHDLLERWLVHSDAAARDELVERLLPFVRRIAQGFAGRGEALDDLVQVGAIGLINAIDRFDLDRNLRLSTYAAPNITGEIKRHFRDRGWAVHVPRGLQELYAQVTSATKKMSDDLGRSPTVMELAEALNSSEEEILEAMNAGRNYKTASLDEPETDDGELTTISALGVEDTGYAAAEDRAVLEECLGVLDPREQRIVALSYLGELRQREVAARLGLSQMHVSRLLRRSLSEMQEAAAAGAHAPAADDMRLAAG